MTAAADIFGGGTRPVERRHPDVFTPEAAAAYLYLDDVRQLETLRRDFGLVGYSGVGKRFRYWRADLDAYAMRMFGRDVLLMAEKKTMRMAR